MLLETREIESYNRSSIPISEKGYPMAKKKRSSSRKMTIPLAFAAPVVMRGIDTGKDLLAGRTADATYVLTGVNSEGKFDAGRIAATYAPIVGGFIIHKVANRLGVNRALAAMKIPFLRV